MRAAIRVDASVDIGTGHVMRCLTLADTLGSKGADVVFICRNLNGCMAGFIRDKGFRVELLPRPQKPAEKLENEVLLHAAFLGVSWQQDAHETYQVLHKQEIFDWLIVDHYAIDDRWHRQLRDVAANIMVIDDLADRSHDCELLLDQNFYLNPLQRYSELVPSTCVSLLGPQFALLRKEFTQNLQPKNCQKLNVIERVFVFMGGADFTNETEKTILALDKLENADFVTDIVVSSVNTRADKIQKMCNDRNYCRFHKDVSNIGQLMLQADLAIGAGGATTLERCYIGLPSLVIMVADNQRETTLALNETGALRCIGWYADINADDIYNNLAELMNDSDVLKIMCSKAKQIFGEGNNQGVKAVIAELLRLG